MPFPMSPKLYADRLRNLPLTQARSELDQVLAAAFTVGYGEEFAAALDFNAQLVTALRERGVKIWGSAPESDSPCV